MKFHVSDKQVRREQRQLVCIILFLVVLSLFLMAKMLSADKISDLIYPFIGLLVLIPPISGTYKRIKEGKNTYPVLELDEPNRKITVLYKDIKVIVDLSQVKNLRLQRKSGQLVSVLLKTSSGEKLRFEGYENLDVLAAALERIVPEENITNASFYHR